MLGESWRKPLPGLIQLYQDFRGWGAVASAKEKARQRDTAASSTASGIPAFFQSTIDSALSGPDTLTFFT